MDQHQAAPAGSASPKKRSHQLFLHRQMPPHAENPKKVISKRTMTPSISCGICSETTRSPSHHGEWRSWVATGGPCGIDTNLEGRSGSLSFKYLGCAPHIKNLRDRCARLTNLVGISFLHRWPPSHASAATSLGSIS